MAEQTEIPAVAAEAAPAATTTAPPATPTEAIAPASETVGATTPAAVTQAATPSGQPEGTKPAEAVLKLPEGVDEGLAKALVDAKTPQAVLDAFLRFDEEAEKQAQSEREKVLDSWRKAVEGDKEIGGVWSDVEGRKKNPNYIAAQKAVVRFGTPELAKLLDSASGNHPEIVRLLVRVGKAAGEDTIAGTTNARPSAPDVRKTHFDAPGYEGLNP